MTGRRFSTPDWGQDHLSLDAVVAYVDDELTAGPHQRAETHLAHCPDCRAEVVAQRQARAALRTAGCPLLPSSLMNALRCIPVEAELPPPPAGLGITADGQFVLLRDVPRGEMGPDGPPSPHRTAGSRRFGRRARFGAVSGLAVGALAVGALAVPGPTASPGPGAPEAPGGLVLTGPVAARLSAGVQPAPIPAVAGPDRAQATIPAVAGSGSDADPARSGPGATAASTASTDPTPDDAAVLDPDLRRRLDRTPVAFYRSP